MATKLTLRMDDHLIKAAKEYAAGTGKSLSRIVSDFFEVIQNEKLDNKPDLSPTVKSLRGVLKGHSVSEMDYKIYIEEKYL